MTKANSQSSSRIFPTLLPERRSSLAAIAGAQAFGTAAAGKHEELRKLGGTPFTYSNKDWISAIRGLGGVDAVFDPLG